jgi:hypothetical protein
MANYYESARSNYFFVKDIEAFEAELEGTGLTVIKKEIDNNLTQVALLASEDGWPDCKYDPDTYDSEELNWEGIFIRHLVDNQVAVIMGAGAEKLRYVSGWAMAYNNKGESVGVNIADIYNLAKELGSEITTATY